MRIIAIILLSYTFYLNYEQTNYLRNASQLKLSKEVSSQITTNIICSYVFSLFIGLLIIFVIKSFF
jgi:capsular polysaccharide biosynthesis protein